MRKKKNNIIRFSWRRLRQVAALVVLIAAVAWLLMQLDQSLYHTPFYTGWTLAGLILFLMGYNLRKRLSFIPILGSSRAWMQLHIYFGFLSVVVFLFHIGFRMPDGKFELLLAGSFAFVSLSGFYGLYITRIVPRKLTAVHQEVVFEKIPGVRRRIGEQARQLSLQCAKNAPALVDFYLEKLVAFFEGRRSLLYFAVPTGRLKRSLIRELSSIDRYLPEDGRQPSEELKNLISQKDDLDFHLAMQGRLKLWLFGHIAATYGMIVLAVFHGLLVYSFHGGLR